MGIYSIATTEREIAAAGLREEARQARREAWIAQGIGDEEECDRLLAAAEELDDEAAATA